MWMWIDEKYNRTLTQLTRQMEIVTVNMIAN